MKRDYYYINIIAASERYGETMMKSYGETMMHV